MKKSFFLSLKVINNQSASQNVEGQYQKNTAKNAFFRFNLLLMLTKQKTCTLYSTNCSFLTVQVKWKAKCFSVGMGSSSPNNTFVAEKHIAHEPQHLQGEDVRAESPWQQMTDDKWPDYWCSLPAPDTSYFSVINNWTESEMRPDMEKLCGHCVITRLCVMMWCQ